MIDGFYGLWSRFEEASRRSPSVSHEIDSWIKSVEELEKEIRELKAVKEKHDKKMEDLKKKHRKAEEEADRLRKKKEAEKKSVSADLASAKKELDDRKASKTDKREGGGASEKRTEKTREDIKPSNSA